MRESRENGKHRTEVTEVTEGGSDWSANFLAGTPRAECEGHAKTEKHRTEVTEVAEGGSDWSANFLAGTPRLECEGQAKTESIAQRSRRSQRGDWQEALRGKDEDASCTSVASTLLLLEYLEYQLQRHPLERCLTNNEAEQR